MKESLLINLILMGTAFSFILLFLILIWKNSIIK
jgi:hypothetical protein